MNLAFLRRFPPLLVATLALSGCLQDTASYVLSEKEHAITLVRNQTWPWQDTLDVEVMLSRLPECNGGGGIKGVARDAALALYQAPDEYAEPLLILKVDQREFAVSMKSCRFQPFDQAQPDLGTELGRFVEKDGIFQFVPAGG